MGSPRSGRHIMGKRLVIALIYFVLSINAFAQTSNATLGGTVSDPTGALIPGVSLTATNTATGIATTVLSNEAGAYQFASLQTGTYKVTAELSGFQTQKSVPRQSLLEQPEFGARHQ